MNENSTDADEINFPSITKKIRDEVVGSSAEYFRRSSFYMSVKACIQHNLMLQYGDGGGKMIYKIFMIRFLARICTPYLGDDCNNFNIDLVSQTIAKLARRIEKLSSMIITDDLSRLYNEAIDTAKKVIRNIRNKINAQIKKKTANNTKMPPLNGLNFETDCCCKMKKLQEYLDERKQDYQQSTGNGFKPPELISYERHFKAEMPGVENIISAGNEIDHRIFWIDFERIVLYKMTIEDDEWSCTDLRAWSFAYAKFAEANYKDNPLFISRMLLVRLKLIAMLDLRATNEHPLLLRHRGGVKIELFKYLLLPQSTDMQIAFELETYFYKRQRAKGPSLIEEKEISERSFSVKFAKDNDIVQGIRREISDQEKTNIEIKRKEYDDTRNKALKDKNHALNTMECDTPRLGRLHYEDSCRKCIAVKRAQQTHIQQYVHLLPEEETSQLAIVFELL